MALLEQQSGHVANGGRLMRLYQDTSGANAILTLVTTAKDYARILRSVSVSLSASATKTTTIAVRRAKLGGGTFDTALASIVISADVEGVSFPVGVVLAPGDVVVVVSPAVAAGETSTVQVLEER